MALTVEAALQAHHAVCAELVWLELVWGVIIRAKKARLHVRCCANLVGEVVNSSHGFAYYTQKVLLIDNLDKL